MRIRESLAAIIMLSSVALTAGAETSVTATVEGSLIPVQLAGMTFDPSEPDTVTLLFADGNIIKADLAAVTVTLDHSGSSAIEEIVSDPSAAPGVYNLRGQRIADTPDGLAPGIYISGGVKILVK